MKLLFTLLIFFIHQANAQSGFKVVYDKIVNESNKQWTPKRNNVLVFNDSLAHVYLVTEVSGRDPYKKNDTVFGQRSRHHDLFYVFGTNEKLNHVAFPHYKKPLLVVDTPALNNFIIQKDNVLYQNMNCQEGYMIEKGDTVFAIISKEIKVPLGPTGYTGLPGLALEIYYSKYNLYFRVKTIEKANYIIQIPDFPRCSWDAYRKKYPR